MPNLILRTALQSAFYHPHLTGEKTEAQRGYVFKVSQSVAGQGHASPCPDCFTFYIPQRSPAALDEDGAGRGGYITVTNRAARKDIPTGNSEAEGTQSAEKIIVSSIN